MRVIAGTARSLRLETIDTMDTRPTTDRIKETLFNIISRELPDCTFLDLQVLLIKTHGSLLNRI